MDQHKKSEPFLCGNYKCLQKLGQGAFGQIYKAVNLKTMNEVAIKFEQATSQMSQLQLEWKLYQILSHDTLIQEKGIPKIYELNTYNQCNILVMELLDKSLEDLFNLCNRKFSLKTVILITLQILNRIEFIHNKTFIHRDIKPDNFMIGTKNNSDKIYIIDFGLSKQYIKNGMHIKEITNKKLTGTARYASINTHRGFEQSRRDDLESMSYMMVYFLIGQLPWQNQKGDDKQKKYDKIRNLKEYISLQELCYGLDDNIILIIQYVRNLKFTETPNYNLIRQYLINMLEKNNINNDGKFDWDLFINKSHDFGTNKIHNKLI